MLLKISCSRNPSMFWNNNKISLKMKFVFGQIISAVKIEKENHEIIGKFKRFFLNIRTEGGEGHKSRRYH